MAKGEIIPFRGDGEAQGFMREPTSPPSRRPAAGRTDNSKTGATAAGSGEDAGVSSASASSTFTSLGDLTHAVVLRLAGGYPKIRGPVKRLGGGTASPARSARPAEGDDAGG